jgi:hypothetical protein
MEVKEKVSELVEEEKDRLDGIIAMAKDYVETRIDLIAINIQDKLTDILSTVFVIAVLWILGVFMLSLISVGVALSLSQYFKDPSIGFYLVGGFYLILCVVLYFNRNKWVRQPFITMLLTKINFHEED